MRTSNSTWGLVGAAFMALTALVQPAAAADDASVSDDARPTGRALAAPDAVALSMRETSKACIPQEDLRRIAAHRCEQLDAVLINVEFVDLCGARGRAPMYSTILYDCRPSRALR
jgi:hypothetical protein